MSVEHTFYCDGPGCGSVNVPEGLGHDTPRHVQTMKDDAPPTFLTVVEHEPVDVVHHFCGWDCLLRFGAGKEPERVEAA